MIDTVTTTGSYPSRRRPALDPVCLAAANINPATGLASDYLNRFHEAIMLLELVPSTPACLNDLAAWRPVSYIEHFAKSRLNQRELALAAYETAEPTARWRLDELADSMNALLAVTLDTLRKPLARGDMHTLATYTAAQLRPLVAEASAVINGQEPGAPVDERAQQVAVDALMAR